jgi:hypothetical protein
MNSAHWTRIGDNAFGLGVERFENSDKKPLWRLQITGHPNDILIDIDLKAPDLHAIKRFCDKALADLASDGGRIKQDVEQAA